MRATFLALLACVSLARADDLKITGTTTVEAHRLVRLSAEGADPKAGLIWRVYPKIDPSNRADTARDKFQFVAAPGTYSVELLSVKLGADGATEISEAAVTVTIGGKSPSPDPPKPDPPKPDPGQPDPKSIYFMIVRPDGPAQPAFTKALEDSGWETLRTNGYMMRPFTVSEAKQYGIELAGGTPLPCVVTLRQTGNVSVIARQAVPMPTTSAGILDLTKGL